MSTSASHKKRKLTSTLNVDSGDATLDVSEVTAILKRCLSTLHAIPDLLPSQYEALLDDLSRAHQLSRQAEDEVVVKTEVVENVEDIDEDALSPCGDASVLDKNGVWDWVVPNVSSRQMEEQEAGALDEMMQCREMFEAAGIRVHPEHVNQAMDLRKWVAHLPGLVNTPWEGGVYTVRVTYTDSVAEVPPKIQFLHPLLHSSVYPSGTWCGHLAQKHGYINGYREDWVRKEEKTKLAKLLIYLQLEMNTPNLSNPCQTEAYTLLRNDRDRYNTMIEAQTLRFTPTKKEGLAGRPAFLDVPIDGAE